MSQCLEVDTSVKSSLGMLIICEFKDLVDLILLCALDKLDLSWLVWLPVEWNSSSSSTLLDVGLLAIIQIRLQMQIWLALVEIVGFHVLVIEGLHEALISQT